MADRQSSQPLNSETMVAIIICTIVAGAVFARRSRWLSPLGRWLQHHHITLANAALVSIPYLGGLDLRRLIAATTVLVLLGLLTRTGARRARSARESAVEKQRPKTTPNI